MNTAPQDAPEEIGSADHSPVSILACGGSLPLEVATLLRERGIEPNIVTIRGMADADFSDFSHRTVGIGQLGALLRGLRANNARDLMIAGHAQRPDLTRLKIDMGFLRHIVIVLRLTRGGDDGLMRTIATFFESQGFSVRGISELTPELLTPTAILAGTMDDTTRKAAMAGLSLVHALGPFDVGQAVLIEDGRILAIEGAEGTNGLIARQGEGATAANSLRLLVKAAKPDQDLRLDLPTIGPETIERCKSAGILTIALEAGRSLILSQTDTAEAAERAQITVAGIAATDVAGEITAPPAPLTSTVRLRSFARKTPCRLDQINAAKGMRLLDVLAHHCAPRAVVLARENALAINILEAMPAFISRCNRLGQWGDQNRKRRAQTLVVASAEFVDDDAVDNITASRIGGIVLAACPNESTLDRLIGIANRHNLFLLSTT